MQACLKFIFFSDEDWGSGSKEKETENAKQDEQADYDGPAGMAVDGIIDTNYNEASNLYLCIICKMYDIY